ncbi:hypothetical protein H6G33_34180 [Calothrix sp. FACHB-1219]|uniref:hypothetical protein n=1 Tax=unclassified Calothrix TaxID=2619626 RepID=UPI0016840538|nr:MULTISPECIES: hypothetical protein [unclassified Calothrix]MBD2207421.1 hypothetical protein [Calothrix sp. FACHB-168]MBD2221997.1 hypothetical protein [Calothrix sp. FACHB-1219]
MEQLFILLLWIGMGFLCSKIAESKRRDKTTWFILGVLGGLITVLVIWFLPAI